MMRPLLLFLCFFPFLGKAQKIVLLDRNFKEPIRAADSITFEHLSAGLFPLYVDDINLLLRQMEAVADDLDKNNLSATPSEERIGNTCLLMRKDRGRKIYRIVLSTSGGSFSSSVVLAKGETARRSLQRLHIFMDYIRNNLSIIKP